MSNVSDSPLRPELVAKLSAFLNDEARRRQKFYEDMTEERKVEFIGGEVVLHSPARNVHLIVTKQIMALLDIWVEEKGLGEVKSEKCLCIFPRNDYEPDIVFFGPEKASRFTPDTMKFPVPDFAIEVLSESTEDYDRGVKFEDYETHGVREYWIVDAHKETVEQYLIRDGHFVLNLNSGTGEIACEVIAGFCIPVRAMFDSAENKAARRALLAKCSATA